MPPARCGVRCLEVPLRPSGTPPDLLRKEWLKVTPFSEVDIRTPPKHAQAWADSRKVWFLLYANLRQGPWNTEKLAPLPSPLGIRNPIKKLSAFEVKLEPRRATETQRAASFSKQKSGAGSEGPRNNKIAAAGIPEQSLKMKPPVAFLLLPRFHGINCVPKLIYFYRMDFPIRHSSIVNQTTHMYESKSKMICCVNKIKVMDKMCYLKNLCKLYIYSSFLVFVVYYIVSIRIIIIIIMLWERCYELF